MDLQDYKKKAISFISSYFKKSAKKTAIVGVSGGIDSAVTLALCVHALGARNTLAVILPSPSTPKRDIQDAISVAQKFGARYVLIELDPFLLPFKKLAKTKLELANLTARLRMAILYLFSQRHNGLVVGTGDKSEFMLGYFTKYGDGAADLFPLAGLYKTQVKELAKLLGLPSRIISKPPSPALWRGQTAQKELGLSYEQADKILQAIEEKKAPSALPPSLRKAFRKIAARIEKNEHKRLPPPACC
ncbi:MAG: NAD+ synthase [Candidatus Micrarchaeota archaeon]|nr:NAD+ synthase [Candidatus Micrarchaeota archaeon]